MSAAHAHSAHMTISRLRLAFALTALVLVVEVVGGILSHSLALLADAGHVLTDIFSLGLAWFAAMQALRPPDARRTFGYHRTGILAALANSAALVVIAIFIGIEAYRRLFAPETVNSGLMLAVAGFGLAMNVTIAWRLARAGGRNLNVRSALLHLLGDAAASAGVIVAAAAIALTGYYVIDAAVSIAVAVLICFGAWRIIGDTIRILMEGTPSQVNVAEMVRRILRVPGIKDVHDLHVWSISNEVTALSCHVLMEDRPTSETVVTLGQVKTMLRRQFGVDHCTIEVECEGCQADTAFCSLQTEYVAEPEHQH